MSQVPTLLSVCFFFPLFFSSPSLPSAWVVILGSRLKRSNDGPEKGLGFYTNPRVELDQLHIRSLAWYPDTLMQRRYSWEREGVV